MTDKTCTICGELKPISEYNRDGKRSDGRQRWRRQCKDCRRVQTKEWRLDNPSYSKEWKAKNPEYHREWISGNAALIKEYRLRLKLKYPHKSKARRIAQYAKSSGKIEIKTSCEDCGVGGKLEMHHEDYSKPLDVVFLCKGCHMARHDGSFRPRLEVAK